MLIAESIHPNKAHIGGRGINMLTGAESIAPIGGAAFHDNKVWVKKAAASAARASVLMESEPKALILCLTRFLTRTGAHFARKRYRTAKSPLQSPASCR